MTDIPEEYLAKAREHIRRWGSLADERMIASAIMEAEARGMEKERERCAKIAISVADETRHMFHLGYVYDAPDFIGKVAHKATQYSDRIATAIRAGGKANE